MRDTGWFTSSRSGGSGANCVEVRITDVAVSVRDSKNAAGPVFSVDPGAWGEFVSSVTDR
jgi:hypothetical protein